MPMILKSFEYEGDGFVKLNLIQSTQFTLGNGEKIPNVEYVFMKRLENIEEYFVVHNDHLCFNPRDLKIVKSESGHVWAVEKTELTVKAADYYEMIIREYYSRPI